jgi:hypothetical protein
MCGRYTLTADLKKVADRFGAPMPEENLEGGSEKGEGREQTAGSFSQNDRNTTEIVAANNSGVSSDSARLRSG